MFWWGWFRLNNTTGVVVYIVWAYILATAYNMSENEMYFEDEINILNIRTENVQSKYKKI